MLLTTYTQALISALKQSNRVKTAVNYSSTLNSALSFFGKDIPFAAVFNPQRLMEYQEHLLRTKKTKNTLSFYMRTLRAIYYKGCEEGLGQKDVTVFAKVYTGNESNRKCALNFEDIVRIEEFDLADHPKLQFVRDMFMLSFYLQGIAFVDLAHLQRSNIKNGSLVYRRRKSGSLIATPICPEAIAIIKRYENQAANSPYLLPILWKNDTEKSVCYETAIRTQNRHLKKMAAIMEIDSNITSYVPRHTWATSAKESGVGMSDISQALGHKDEKTTRIYVERLSIEPLIKANFLIKSKLDIYRRKNKRKKGRRGEIKYGQKMSVAL